MDYPEHGQKEGPKSVSRFSRNTLEAVRFIQRLRGMGVRLIFEKESIDTESDYSAMLLTVLAAFAQEESRSHSENVKWGKRKRAMNGDVPLYPPYGYRKSADGTTMVIVPEEAEVVRFIFQSYNLKDHCRASLKRHPATQNR